MCKLYYKENAIAVIRNENNTTMDIKVIAFTRL